MFEDFIRNAITYRHNIMCYITAHDMQQLTYVDDTSSAGYRKITNNATTAALKPLGATIKFIDFCLIQF